MGEVPLELLDHLLASVADVIHDRPVQQAVAARLLLETAIPLEERSPILERALGAVDNAGQLSRDVMWALTPAEVRQDHLAGDLGEMASRAEAEAVSVAASLTPWTVLEPLTAAIHDVLAEVVLRGGVANRVAIEGDAHGATATITTTPGNARTAGSPWLRLAQHRLASAEGSLELLRSEEEWVITLRIGG